MDRWISNGYVRVGEAPDVTSPDYRDRLAVRTLTLANMTSVSRDEGAILRAIRDELEAHRSLEILDDGDGVVFAGPRVRRVDAPFIVLAGHADTVPIAGARLPAVAEGDAIVGRGTSDMKAGIAVMLELAAQMEVAPGRSSDLDVGFLVFGREELPITESALLPLFDRCPVTSTIELAVVMEPTDNGIEVGCLGNLNAEVIVEGRAAHSARPWLGDNAIHAAIEALAPLADLPDRDVTIDGLTFREVVSVTTIEGGVATNVVPDRVRAHVNYRYAPTHAPGRRRGTAPRADRAPTGPRSRSSATHRQDP